MLLRPYFFLLLCIAAINHPMAAAPPHARNGDKFTECSSHNYRSVALKFAVHALVGEFESHPADGFVDGGTMPEVEEDSGGQESPGLMLADRYYGAGCNWRLVDRGDGYFSLENQHFAGSFLDVDGDKRSLMLADKYEGAGCNWKLSNRGDGFFSLENQHFPGHYLDVVGGRRMLKLADKYDGRECNWKKVDRGDGYFSFSNQHMEGCFLDVDGRFRR